MSSNVSASRTVDGILVSGEMMNDNETMNPVNMWTDRCNHTPFF